MSEQVEGKSNFFYRSKPNTPFQYYKENEIEWEKIVLLHGTNYTQIRKQKCMHALAPAIFYYEVPKFGTLAL